MTAWREGDFDGKQSVASAAYELIAEAPSAEATALFNISRLFFTLFLMAFIRHFIRRKVQEGFQFQLIFIIRSSQISLRVKFSWRQLVPKLNVTGILSNNHTTMELQVRNLSQFTHDYT